MEVSSFLKLLKFRTRCMVCSNSLVGFEFVGRESGFGVFVDSGLCPLHDVAAIGCKEKFDQGYCVAQL